MARLDSPSFTGGRPDLRVLGRPHIVTFAGFEGTTHSMARAGWQIAVRENFDRDTIDLLVRHEESGLKMVAYGTECNFMRHEGQILHFDVRRAGTDMQGRREAAHTVGLSPLEEGEPQFKLVDHRQRLLVDFNPQAIEDFSIFTAKSETILIEPESVEECLALIKRLQAPVLAEVRQRDRTRERLEASGQKVLPQGFHAQILSFSR